MLLRRERIVVEPTAAPKFSWHRNGDGIPTVTFSDTGDANVRSVLYDVKTCRVLPTCWKSLATFMTADSASTQIGSVRRCTSLPAC